MIYRKQWEPAQTFELSLSTWRLSSILVFWSENADLSLFIRPAVNLLLLYNIINKLISWNVGIDSDILHWNGVMFVHFLTFMSTFMLIFMLTYRLTFVLAFIFAVILTFQLYVTCQEQVFKMGVLDVIRLILGIDNLPVSIRTYSQWNHFFN